jgi:hypothetical protein
MSENPNTVGPTLDGRDFVPGRLVRYVDGDGKIYPMIIVKTKKYFTANTHRVDGVAFGEFGALYVADVLYDQNCARNTWHWPPRPTRKPKPQPQLKPKPQLQAGKPIFQRVKQHAK